MFESCTAAVFGTNPCAPFAPGGALYGFREFNSGLRQDTRAAVLGLLGLDPRTPMLFGSTPDGRMAVVPPEQRAGDCFWVFKTRQPDTLPAAGAGGPLSH